MPKTTIKQEFYIALAGLSGICFYYLLENIALTYTYASNVSVICCCAPFFIAILSMFFLNKKFGIKFFIGFIISIAGIAVISFNGTKIHLNPLGDLLALTASVTWAIYSLTIKKISSFGFPTLLITRKTFVYGIIFMIPMLFLFDFHFDLARFSKPLNITNILFLGFIASALCFAVWNKAIKILGAVKCTLYIYLMPIITVIFSILILKENVTPLLLTGTTLTLLGLILSETDKNR